MKKIFALLLSCILLLTGTTLAFAAEEAELIVNGDFEVLNANGTVYGWTYYGDSFGARVETETVQSGKYAMRYKTETSVYLNQTVNGLVDTCTYDFSFWTYIIEGSRSTPRVKFEFRNAEGALCGEVTIMPEKITKNKWEQHSFKVTPPQGTVSASIMVRYMGSSAVDYIWDGISLKGQRAEGVEATPLPESAPYKKLYPDTPTVAYNEETAKEFLVNGSFEKVTTAGKPVRWSLKETGGTVNCTAEDAADGRFATELQVTGSATGVFIYQGISNLLPGAEFKLSGNIKVKGAIGSASINLVWSNATAGEITTREIPLKPSAVDTWEPFEMMIQAPAEADGVQIWLRTKTKNLIMWDNVSFKGALDMDSLPKNMEVLPFASGTGELLVNGNLETDAGGKPEGWEISGNTWDTAYTKDPVNAGNRVVYLQSDKRAVSPYISQLVKVVPGVTYQLSCAINLVENGATMGIMPEITCYSSDVPSPDTKVYFETLPSFIKAKTYGEWVVRAWEFSVPAGSKTMDLWMRWFREGEAYIDNISLRMVGKHLLDTNDFFYYTDIEEGIATARTNKAAWDGDLEGHTVDFALKDGETFLFEKKGADLSGGETKFFFPVAAMQELRKEYTVAATFKDETGASIETLTTPVSRWDRPTVLNKEGEWVEDGVPLNPVMGYHVKPEKFPRMVELGVNVIQTYSSSAFPDKIVEKVDEIYSYGMKALVVLYRGVNGGAPTHIENTREIARRLKGHKGVFAYAVVDEPYSGGKRTVDIDNEMYEAYKVIRTMDPDKPVFITDAKNIFEPIQKRSDIMNLDIYPAGDNGNGVIETLQAAKEASYNNDSIMTITQMYQWQGVYPTVNQFRSWIYLGFFAGAKSTGFYAFDENSPEGIPVEDADLGIALEEWNKKEKELVFDCFINDKYPEFAGEITEGCTYRIYVKDGKLYVFVVNCNVESDITASIPLVSANGRIKIGNYAGTVYAGADLAEFSGNGTLDLTLTPGQATVYILTPSEPIDASLLSLTSFIDIEEYSWAKEEIAALEKVGAVNAKGEGLFAPGENITRGDFAMFLIRALDLRSYTEAEQFTDVPSDAYYAKEIGVGRALGLFKGMGDGTYGPETPISRQDLMVICARAMRLVSKLKDGGDTASLSGFTDAASIADYAKADVAAMTSAGVIRGNGDGTVNPLGNTTRAEAAVIMHRICQ